MYEIIGLDFFNKYEFFNVSEKIENSIRIFLYETWNSDSAHIAMCAHILQPENKLFPVFPM